MYKGKQLGFKIKWGWGFGENANGGKYKIIERNNREADLKS